MLNERQQKLLAYLKQLERPISLEQLSSYFKMSERTIRNDIKLIQMWASSLGIQIHFKKSLLHIDSQATQQLNAVLTYDISVETYINTPMTRQLYITMSLLMANDVMSLHDLATQYQASKSTIATDIKTISSWLQQVNITLKSTNQGYFIETTELQRRISMINLMEWLEHSYMSTAAYTSIAWENLSHKDIAKFNSVFEQYGALFTCKNMPVYEILLVQYERLKNRQDDFEVRTKFQVVNPISELTKKLAVFYEQLHIHLTEGDQLLIQQQLLLYQKLDGKSSHAVEQTQLDYFIDLVREHLSLGFMNDETVQLIKCEIEGLIYWCQQNVVRYSPLHQSVSSNFKVICNVLHQCFRDLNATVEIPLPMWTDVVLLLAGELEYQESKSQKLRAILVCPSGSATSYFLEKKLQRYFHNVEIVLKLSVEEVKQIDQSEVDLIISTVLLQNIRDNVIVIPPLIDEKHMQVLSQFIQSIEKERKVSNSSLEQILPSDCITYVEEAHTIEQLIVDGIHILSEKQLVDHSVKAELLAVYQKYGLYFEILPGVIMPHIISVGVKKASVSCICLKNPLMCNGRNIHTVITLVSPNETEHIHILKNLYELLSATKSGKELNTLMEKRGVQHVK